MFNPSLTAAPGPAPSGAAPKLRDSCDACASSKLKCHKQKPTCSRCEKRGVTCHYLATRRAGRRYDSRRPGSEQGSASFTAGSATPLGHLHLDNWFGTPALDTTAPSAPSGEENVLGQMAAPAFSTGTASLSPSNTSSRLSPSLPSPVDYSAIITDESDLDNYLRSPASFTWAPDSAIADMMGELDADFFSVLGSANDNNVKGNQSVENQNDRSLGVTHNKEHNNDSNTTAESRALRPGASKALASCLMRATGLLQQFFPQSCTVTDPVCTDFMENGTQRRNADDSIPYMPAITAMITTNTQTLDAVGIMLQCSCSRNGYLLSIMSLVVFKVVESYSSAVTNTAQVYTLDEDPTYKAAQLVLGELHQVQRLVNQLSAKIKEQSTAGEELQLTDSRSSTQDRAPVATPACNEMMGGDNLMPFSSIMLHQLEADMRRRLKCLKTRMVGYLKRD